MLNTYQIDAKFMPAMLRLVEEYRESLLAKVGTPNFFGNSGKQLHARVLMVDSLITSITDQCKAGGDVDLVTLL